MKFWIDCEFNGYLGELISLALVDEAGLEWYESLGCSSPTAWVAQNVMPVVGIASTTREAMQESLAAFLLHYDSVHIVADWPDDIRYLCGLIITGPGERIETPPLSFEIVTGLDAPSARPHNALEDVRALRRSYLSAQLAGGRLGSADTARLDMLEDQGVCPTLYRLPDDKAPDRSMPWRDPANDRSGATVRELLDLRRGAIDAARSTEGARR